MILTYCYRLLPSRHQHRALEALLEGQRQLYNAALEERIEAHRKARVTRTYVDQCKALTEWRQSDPDAASVPVCLQRWTLKQLDEAYRGFFRRLKAGAAPGFPRFRGKGRFDSFGFREFSGIRFENGRLRFKRFAGRAARTCSPAAAHGCLHPLVRLSPRREGLEGGIRGRRRGGFATPGPASRRRRSGNLDLCRAVRRRFHPSPVATRRRPGRASTTCTRRPRGWSVTMM